VTQHVVRLDEAERAVLTDLIAGGVAPARAQTHARILLKADRGAGGPGWADARVAEALEVSVATVARVRRTWVAAGWEAAVHRRPQPPRPARRKLDGHAEAHLIAVACSDPPAGRARWTLRLLADKLVALEVVDAVSHEAVRQALKKTNSSRG
jgi:transposase